MGATLAGQVREEEQPLGACRRTGRLGDEQFIRIDLLLLGCHDFALRELIAEPLKTSACREHAAENAPHVWHRMTHRVNATQRITRRLFAMRKYDAARPKRRADDTSRHDAIADRARRLIAT